jgi:hypothetical protein
MPLRMQSAGRARRVAQSSFDATQRKRTNEHGVAFDLQPRALTLFCRLTAEFSGAVYRVRYNFLLGGTFIPSASEGRAQSLQLDREC